MEGHAGITFRSRVLAMICSLFVGLVAVHGQAATVQLFTDDAALAKARIIILSGWLQGPTPTERQLIGFVSDHIDVPDGTVQLSVNTPYGATLEFLLLIQGERVKLKDHRWIDTHCDGKTSTKNRVASWPTPEVSTPASPEVVTKVTFRKPTVKPRKILSACIRDIRGLGPPPVTMMLDIASEPPGAEIYVNGYLLDKRSNVRKKVYDLWIGHAYEKQVWVDGVTVLLRKKGFVNCLVKVPFKSGTEKEVRCVFRKIE